VSEDLCDVHWIQLGESEKAGKRCASRDIVKVNTIDDPLRMSAHIVLFFFRRRTESRAVCVCAFSCVKGDKRADNEDFQKESEANQL